MPGQSRSGTQTEDSRRIENPRGWRGEDERSPPVPPWSGVPERSTVVGGAAWGRLLQQGKPLANCRVVIVPFTKSFRGYSPDKTKPPSVAVTNEQGLYHFDDVAPGPYKLSWLPEGYTQWIRRIAFQPDVVVQPQQTARIKDIRAALRTAN